MNTKASLIKVLFIFLILLICYFIEYYIKVCNYFNHISAIFALILQETEALIIGIFISIKHVNSWHNKGKIKINYIFLISAVILVLLHVPYILHIPHSPLIYFYTNRVLNLLSATFFWYFIFHAFYKTPVNYNEGNDIQAI